MKYTVEIKEDGYTEDYYDGLSKKEAIATAKEESKKNPDRQVFISWFRKSDGQRGYLNPSGDHAITGQAW